MFPADLVLNCKTFHTVCSEIIVLWVQPAVALLIVTFCHTGLISGELNNSEVNDSSFFWRAHRDRLKDLCRTPVAALEITALIVLGKEFRHKLWVYDVVSSLVGLHHMEAAVATAVERPSKQRGEKLLCLSSYYFLYYKQANMHLWSRVLLGREQQFCMCGRRGDAAGELVVFGLLWSWTPAHCL